MVATDGQVVTTHDEIADFTWPERARHAITEVDRPVYMAPLDVGEHSFERRHVAVMSAMTAIRIGLPTRSRLASSLSSCIHR